MTTKNIYLCSAFALLFAGGFLAPNETSAWTLILLGCVGFILYTLEQ